MDTRYRRVDPFSYTYEVDAITENVILGTVKQFGSLPSMRHWRAKPKNASNPGWGPPRRTRDLARADLINFAEEGK